MVVVVTALTTKVAVAVLPAYTRVPTSIARAVIEYVPVPKVRSVPAPEEK